MMIDDSWILAVGGGAVAGLIVAAFNAVITWWSAIHQRGRKRRYLELRIAHQLEAYAVQCNDYVEVFRDAIQPMIPEFPSPIESDAYEFLDHGVVDRYFRFSQRPNRENRSLMRPDQGSDNPDGDRAESELNHSMCIVRDEAESLAQEVRRRSSLRARAMEWRTPSAIRA